MDKPDIITLYAAMRSGGRLDHVARGERRHHNGRPQGDRLTPTSDSFASKARLRSTLQRQSESAPQSSRCDRRGRRRDIFCRISRDKWRPGVASARR
jgi:hypothetical protein